MEVNCSRKYIVYFEFVNLDYFLDLFWGHLFQTCFLIFSQSLSRLLKYYLHLLMNDSFDHNQWTRSNAQPQFSIKFYGTLGTDTSIQAINIGKTQVPDLCLTYDLWMTLTQCLNIQIFLYIFLTMESKQLPYVQRKTL